MLGFCWLWWASLSGDRARCHDRRLPQVGFDFGRPRWTLDCACLRLGLVGHLNHRLGQTELTASRNKDESFYKLGENAAQPCKTKPTDLASFLEGCARCSQLCLPGSLCQDSHVLKHIQIRWMSHCCPLWFICHNLHATTYADGADFTSNLREQPRCQQQQQHLTRSLCQDDRFVLLRGKPRRLPWSRGLGH